MRQRSHLISHGDDVCYMFFQLPDSIWKAEKDQYPAPFLYKQLSSHKSKSLCLHFAQHLF